LHRLEINGAKNINEEKYKKIKANEYKIQKNETLFLSKILIFDECIVKGDQRNCQIREKPEPAPQKKLLIKWTPPERR
jgi:hypothetical protein